MRLALRTSIALALGMGVLGAGMVTPPAAFAEPPAVAKPSGEYRGINLAGAEFSANGLPSFDHAASFAFIASRGYTLVRLPFLWESMQPTLSGPLREQSLDELEAAVADASAAGLHVVLDVHNYAAYGGTAYGQPGSFSQADFADLWSRLSLVFRSDPTVVGYGLMNEPRNLPTVDGVSGNVRWQRAQQAALDAIRANGDLTCVLVSGYTAATMGGWLNPTNGQPVPFITDPIGNFRWEAHQYWDVGSTGTYTSTYADSVAAGFGSSRGDAARTSAYFALDQWIAWLTKYDQKGYIGEFGWPSVENGANPADAAAWNDLAAMFLARVNQEHSDLLWTTAWATGSRWSSKYALQFYSSTDGVLSTPLSNAAVLEANAREVNPLPVTLPHEADEPGADVPAAPPAAAPGVVAGAGGTATSVVRPAASKVRVVVVGSHRRHPRLTVRVRSRHRVTGTVTVRLGSRVLARAVRLHKGKAVITIRATLSRRPHTLVVRYAGSSTVAASRARTMVRPR